MCQNNCTTKIEKNKPVEEFQLGIIENALNNNQTIKEIAELIGKDVSSVRKLIKRYARVTTPRKKCETCLKFETCVIKGLCEQSKEKSAFCRTCKGCKKAIDICKEYESKYVCEKLKGRRHACNGCKEQARCMKSRRIFEARHAIEIIKANKKNSIKKTKISKISQEDKSKFDKYVSGKIKEGVSVDVTLGKIPKEIKEVLNISTKTLYRYINKCLMTCRNIDLRNKVGREVNEEEGKRKTTGKAKHRENGRSVHDMTEEEKLSKNIVEMDTVEGKKGGNLLLTMIFKEQKFMLGLPMVSKHMANVVAEMDKIEEKLGTEKFKELFRSVVTDNGTEFLDYNGLETSKNTGEKRFSLYYADPYASYQKPLVENNHRIIRYMLEKGYDMTKLTEKEILNVMNRVNNYPRKSLGYKSPYEKMLEVLDSEILEKFGFYYIPFEELNMNKKRVA